MPILPREAFYFPVEKGVYEVAPGLRPLGFDFGNGEADRRVFQIDERWPKYRHNKIDCRAEKLDKYLLFHRFEPQVRRTVADYFMRQLAIEYPKFFTLKDLPGGGRELDCLLTEERLEFDADLELTGCHFASKPVEPRYASAFDALASQVPEDVAVMRSEDGANYLSAIQLCSSGHWSPAEKIGRDFIAIHQPVPGIDKINRAAGSFVEAMVRKGPFVRFAWGFATDDRLNHHPDPPEGIDVATWRGRKFHSPAESKFYLRVERQVMVGFPGVDASLFTIRVYYFEGTRLKGDPEKARLLASALESMTPDQRRYKGLEGSLEPLVDWLRA